MITFLLVYPRRKGEFPSSHQPLDFWTCESEIWEEQHRTLADSQHMHPPGETTANQNNHKEYHQLIFKVTVVREELLPHA